MKVERYSIMDSQDEKEQKPSIMEHGQLLKQEQETMEPLKQEEEENNQHLHPHESTGTNHTQNSHDDTFLDGHASSIPIHLLYPPMTRRERFRDWVLRTLDRPCFQITGLIVMFLVVADGALFFFFLIGWQTLCDYPTKTNCSPRNEIYNISVQLLTWLFTYMATISMPWRCANFIQIFGCGKRDNTKGLDLYGRPTNEVWFHIGWWHRAGIISCLILNCLLQYANESTRLIFYTYKAQDVSPGVFWVNIFFGSSFIFAGIGALWITICCERLRKKHPGRFGPGVAELVQKYCSKVWTWIFCRSEEPEQESIEGELDEYENELRHAEEEDDQDDPTHYPFNALGVQRAGLRLFAM